MQPTILLLIVNGLLFATVACYLFLFRPADRRTLLLAITLLCFAISKSFSVWLLAGPTASVDEPSDVAIPALAVLAGNATFLGFAALFPQTVALRSVSGVALLSAAAWWVASLTWTGLALGGDFPLLLTTPNVSSMVLGPGAAGNTIVTIAVVLARLHDLRKNSGAAARATPYFLLVLPAQMLTSAGFESGRLAFRAFQGEPLLNPAPVAIQTSVVLAAFVVPLVLAVYAALSCRFKVPAWLVAAGLVSSIPFMLRQDLDPQATNVLRLWGGMVGPGLVMYAQAKWDALPGEPRGIAPTIAVTAFASLFAYAFVAVFATVAIPPSDIRDLVVPLIGIAGATGMALLVLPRARRLDLGRILAATNHGPLAPGVVVLGRYRVVRLIGEGGQARVYEAQETRKPGRRVVLKAVASHEGLREARILQGLRHPNIVPFIEVVEVPGATLVVLKFAEGGTLRGLLNRRGGRLAPDEAHKIADGVLAGLAAAHAAGVMHRDVKAENVLLGEGDNPMLADFGIARAPDAGRTMRPGSSGTLAYMAPEQVRGEAGDQRSDVYAAAILVHELMTGKPAIVPEPGDEFRTRKAILTRAPKLALPPSARRFSLVLQQALAKDPDARPRDAAAFRASLMPAWPESF